MKRFICLILCAAFLISTAMPVSAAVYDHEALVNRIATAMVTTGTLDISEYKLTRDEMLTIYEEVFHRGLLPWYADSYCDWSSAPDGTITVIRVRDLRERGYSEDKYERAMAELLAATCHEGMTDLQKILSVHDYIVANTEYSYLPNINTGYHALVRGQTKCYGYAQLFLQVMNRLGIPCQIIVCDDTGDGIGHAWNVVEVAGSWYHLDLTWDDPGPDAPGKAEHTYFLKTDKEFRRELNHDFDWYPDIGCNGGTFKADDLWEYVSSPVIFLDAETAFLRRVQGYHSFLYRANPSTGQEELLYKVQGDSFSGSLYIWSDRIWFNSVEAVYSMNTDGTDIKTEFAHDLQKEQSYIYGFQIINGVLNVSILKLNGDDYSITVETSEQSYPVPHTHEYEAVRISATCEESGYIQKACSCGITYQIERTGPLGHDLTESPDGSRKECKNCDYYVEETVPTTVPATTPTEPLPTETKSASENAAIFRFLVPCILIVLVAVPLAVTGVVLLIVGKKKRRQA